MIQATLDVNVLASGFHGKPGVPASLMDVWSSRSYELILSEHILDGLSRTWRKPYFRDQMTPDRIQKVLLLLRRSARMVAPTADVQGVGEDREDDLVLATAISGGAEYLVTGDKHLQRIGSYQGVVILSPRDFLAVLDDR